MSAWVRVGAKCVCVDNSAHRTDGAALLIKGAVYTIRAIEDCGPHGFGLLLVEVVNSPVRYVSGFSEPVYRIDRFRPLVTKTQEQDLALFSHLLDGVSVPEVV